MIVLRRVAAIMLDALSAAAAVVATAVAPPMPPPSPGNPPIGMGDEAERWIAGLRPHHGPDERCNYDDCEICWATTPAADE